MFGFVVSAALDAAMPPNASAMNPIQETLSEVRFMAVPLPRFRGWDYRLDQCPSPSSITRSRIPWRYDTGDLSTIFASHRDDVLMSRGSLPAAHKCTSACKRIGPPRATTACGRVHQLTSRD